MKGTSKHHNVLFRNLDLNVLHIIILLLFFSVCNFTLYKIETIVRPTTNMYQENLSQYPVNTDKILLNKSDLLFFSIVLSKSYIDKWGLDLLSLKINRTLKNFPWTLILRKTVSNVFYSTEKKDKYLMNKRHVNIFLYLLLLWGKQYFFSWKKKKSIRVRHNDSAWK